ncbi:SspB family protein [Hellea balneolensis]|uniref:SspB family protein n=1 Tax=Hellea balneolensis TaxID=287478 RepID=UPI0003FD0515|nr:ClpXP protease specificity-enhancing factor SspB [Hellea balneolensis]
MSQDLMNYEQMTQLALRGVVRDAIRRVIREDGLPGAHHFYITFLTRYPGAEIDEGLAKKYPEEITIVLEHQFWDLQAHADEFEVTLKFGGIPKYLKVPYHAITRFHDPSVGFALQFDPPKEMETSAPDVTQIKPAKTPKPKTAKAKKGSDAKADKPKAEEAETTKEPANKVVSLDAFRKK